MPNKLLLVGNPEEIHIGGHLYRAAGELGVLVHMLDIRSAFVAPRWLRAFNWRLRGHRPTRLEEFSAKVVRECGQFQPDWLLTTGIAPVLAEALAQMGGARIQRINYLTDDPWSPSQRTRWFMKSLKNYDHVFSPRRANIGDLQRCGCQEVSYPPFGYSPHLHFPVLEAPARKWDVIFAGGADRDRVPWVTALIRAGFSVALYGGYWERYPETRRYALGHADPGTLRAAVAQSGIALGLVRRANRDGHSMRTYEVPAMRACMLTEDTPEHREIFGDDGCCVSYFNSVSELIGKARWLLSHDDERRRLAASAYDRVVGGANTYTDRLASMLRFESGAPLALTQERSEAG